ncbi:MAG TPA: hypothetical protein VFS40_00420 [Gemmatimonadales bacterium]|nr:hypothetical protein [Gemmatimonadales bacterium]
MTESGSGGWQIPLEVHVDRENRFVRILLAGEVVIEGSDLPFELIEAAINEAMLRRAGVPPESEIHHDPEALARFKEELRRIFDPAEGDEADDDEDEEEDEGGEEGDDDFA